MPPKKGIEPCKKQKETYAGIGAILESTQHRPVIVGLLEGGPAQKAGLKVWDIILKVNGQDTLGSDLYDVSARIKGRPQSVVVLTIRRTFPHRFFKVRIIRQVVTLGIFGKTKGKPCYKAQVWHGD
ncbi:PDZ domain-containing protein [Helicobacter baculiformis]|uniref:PDZ domain-containing protein n=1 Tax=Helicobacter baculiformis TaxID=427351 RepID=A0ABV7ZEJ5_9HELI|nr:PDZ domain-containing protein [Helicobacter baculiformis]